MSTADDLAYLKAQRAVVAAQLERTPAERRPMRINLESRLRLIDDEIAALGLHEDIRARAHAVLTFGGKPVVDEGVIEASFGADALQAFQRLVSTTAATREGRPLGARGPIPDEEEYRLFLTGTFPGSFGFELEDRATEPAHEPGVLLKALDEATRLLVATRMGDESYTDAVAESNPRVVRALADFLGLLETRGATLDVAAGERECRFDTPEDVSAAAERARRTKINEAEEAISGELSGVFDAGRRFEFKPEGNLDVINGRISYAIAEPSSLKPYLWTRCVAHVWIVTVERAGKEQRTYYLTRVESLAEEEASHTR